MLSHENRYPRTDLACEFTQNEIRTHGVDTNEYSQGGFGVTVTKITSSEASERLGKPLGTYFTVSTGRTRMLSDSNRGSLVSLISELIGNVISSAVGKKDFPSMTALVAGIGNRHLTADAVGPFVADRITVTRELKYRNNELFERLECADVSAVSPGVAAETGIEASDIIKAAANTIGADVIVLIDALAAISCERLASTVQITNIGTSPGSGIGNTRTPITREEMGVPVVTVGVPTVVDSSTLVYGALSESGADPESVNEQIFTRGRSFFVSPQDIDVVVDDYASLLAESIDTLFGTR